MEYCWIILIVSIVMKVCDCSCSESLLKLLNFLFGLLFFNFYLRLYLSMFFSSGLFLVDFVVFLRNVIKIMNELF